MENNKGKDIVPSLDQYQYDDSLFENININDFGNDHDPTFADMWQYEGPSTDSSSLPQQNNGNGQGHENRIGPNETLYDNDPFLDTMIQQWGTSSINNGGNFEAGLSEVHGQKSHPYPNASNLTFNIDTFLDPMIQHVGTSSINQGGNFEMGPPELDRENSHPYPNGPGNSSETMPPLLWPESQLPSFCDSCSMLREIVHTNGDNVIKLEIHGRVGLIRHAIHKQSTNNGACDSQMFDLSEKSYEEIKIFLTKYCLHHKSSGYDLIPDPLSTYYEALCVGLDLSTRLNDEPHPNLGALSPNVEQEAPNVEQEAEAEVGVERAPKNTVAIQRERVGKMTLVDFTDYFHLPIEDAAKKVNLCPTVIKKICRKEGLKRWPHRKLKALVKQISSLKQRLNAENPESRELTQAEIDRLEEEMIQHCGGICPTLVEES